MAVSSVFFLAAPAYAQCTSPDGIEGEMVYNGAYQTMQYCDGTDWRDMGSGNITGTLGGLSDVELSGLTGGECVTYNNISGDWESGSCAGGAPGPDRGIVFNSGGAFFSSTGFFVDSNFNVGIGTSNPQANLNISAASQPNLRFDLESQWDLQFNAGAWDNNTFSLLFNGSSFVQQWDVVNGQVGIYVNDPDTTLDVGGTLKIDYGGESCDASREGAIHYNSSDDEFYVCATAGGWDVLSTDTATTPDAPDRGIQFNSGNAFTADANFVFTSKGELQLTGSGDETSMLEIEIGGLSRRFTSFTNGGGTERVAIGMSSTNYPYMSFFDSSGGLRAEIDTRPSGGALFEAYPENSALEDGAPWSYGAAMFIVVPEGVGNENGIAFKVGGLLSQDPGAAITHYDTTSGGPGNGGLRFKTRAPGGGLTTYLDIDQHGTVRFTSTGALVLPMGDTAQRPDAAERGMLRYNSANDRFEGYQGSSWAEIQTSAAAAAAPDRGIQFNSGNAFTANSNFVYTSTGELQLAGASGNLFLLDSTSNAINFMQFNNGAGNTVLNSWLSSDYLFMGLSGDDGTERVAFDTWFQRGPYIQVTAASGSAGVADGVTDHNGSALAIISENNTLGNEAGITFGDRNTSNSPGAVVSYYDADASWLGKGGLRFKTNPTGGGGGPLTRMQIDETGIVRFTSTGAIVLPVGDTGQRPDAAERGMLRYNSANDRFEGYQGSSWAEIQTSAAAAATPDRGIQFNSGGQFFASSGLVYTNAGNVGIGTNNPQSPLHVSVLDDGGVQDVLTFGNETGSDNFTFSIDPDWGYEFNLRGPYGTDRFEMDIGGSDTGSIQLTAGRTPAGSGSDQRITMIAADYVRIGHDSPSASDPVELHFFNSGGGTSFAEITSYGTGSSQGRMEFNTRQGVSDWNDNQLFLDDLGNIGMGVDFASARLQVAGTLIVDYGGEACDASREGAIHYDSSDNSFYLCDGTSGWQSIATSSGGSLWTQDGANVYRSSGSVGIGTDSPSERLDVEGGYALLPMQNSAPGDAVFANSQYALWADEANTEFEMKFRSSGGGFLNHTLISKDSSGAGCSVSVNNVQTASMPTAPGNTITISNYAVPSVTDGILFIAVSAENDQSSTFGVNVTFGGSAVTLAADNFQPSSGDKYAGLYYELNPSGTGDVVVTTAEDVEAIEVAAYTISCLEQQAPEATNTGGTSGTALTTAVTTSTPNAVIVDAFEHGDNTTLSTTEAGQTLIYQNTTGTGATTTGGASYRLAGVAGSYDMSWSGSGGSNTLSHAVAAFQTSDLSTGDANISLDEISDVVAQGAATDNVLTWTGTTWQAAPIPAAGADTQIQYNNSGNFAASNDLVWDYTNGRMGVNLGGDSPGAHLHVDPSSNSIGLVVEASDSGDFYTAVQHSQGPSYSGNTSLISSGAGDTHAPLHIGVPSVGTDIESYGIILLGRKGSAWNNTANPVSQDDVLPGIGFAGQSNTTGSGMMLSAQINAEVDGPVSGSVVPMRLAFRTSQTNSSAMAERMRITSDGLVRFTSTGALVLPTGDTGQRPDAAERGMLRYNSANDRFEGYQGSSWAEIQTSAAAAAAPDRGIQFNSGGAFTADSNFTYDISTGQIVFGTDGQGIARDGPIHIVLGDQVFLDYDGNVGIGEENDPGYNLDVLEGDAGGVSFSLNHADTNSWLFVVDNAVNGNLTLSQNRGSGGYIDMDTVTALRLPAGPDGDRPAGVAGMIRYNSTSDRFEGYQGSSWAEIQTSAAAAASPDRGIQFNSGGAFTADANFVFTSGGRLNLGTSSTLGDFVLGDSSGSGNTVMTILAPDNAIAALRFSEDNAGQDGFFVQYKGNIGVNQLEILSDSAAEGQIRRVVVERDNGNVGIGDMNTPDTRLDVSGTIKMAYGGEACDASREGAIHYDSSDNSFYLCDGASGWQSIATSSGGSLWTENGANIYRSSGSVGIGTTSPGNELEVVGTVQADALQLDGVSGDPASFAALNDLSDVDTAGYADGEVLTYSAGASGWVPGTVSASASAAGSDRQIQFNSGNAFAASGDFTYSSAGLLTLSGYSNGALRPVMDMDGFIFKVKPDWQQEFALEAPYGDNVFYVRNPALDSSEIILSAGSDTGDSVIEFQAGNRFDFGHNNPTSSNPVRMKFEDTDGGSPASQISSWFTTSDGFMELNVRNAGLADLTDDLLFLDGRTAEGRVGIGVDYASTRLHVDGTIRMAYGGEACDAAREGAIHYDSSSDEFYVCRTAGSWDSLPLPGGGLWADNTTHISYQSVHILKTGETVPAGFNSYTGETMFYHADESTMVGGYVQSGTWSELNESNIGQESFGWGHRVGVGGSYSVAFGLDSRASGNMSFAAGEGAVASEARSFAFGRGATASGAYGVVFGHGLEVSGTNSFGVALSDQSGVTLSSANTFGLFGGSMVIDPAAPATNLSAETALEIAGSIKIAYGGEVCDAAREGAIHYDSSDNSFYLCDGTSGWQSIATSSGGSLWTQDGANVYRSSGSVGIGNNSPSYPLDVTGTARATDLIITGKAGDAPVFFNLNDLGDVSAAGPSADDVLKWNGSNWVAGRSALSDLSDVDTTGFADGEVLTYSAGASGWVSDTVSASASAAGSDRQIQFNSGGSFAAVSDFVYTSTGRLGLGTSAPEHLLDVGDQSALRMWLSNTTNTDADTYSLGMSGGANPPRRFTLLSAEGSSQQVLQFGDGGTGDTIFGIGSSTNGGAGWSPVFAVQGSGRIGLGDNDPDALLELSLSGGAGSPFMISSNDGNDGDLFYVSSTGRVGIGTTSPETEIDVAGTIKMAYGGEACDASREGAIHYDSSDNSFYLCDGTSGWQSIATSSGGSLWTQDGANVYRSSGNVGIGNSSPSYPLDVTGTARATDLIITGEAGDAPSAMLLGDLGDVDTSGYADGEVLLYSAGASGWVAGTTSGALNDLSDVDTTGFADGEVLTYSAGASGWVSDTVSASASAAGSDRQIQFNSGGAFAAESGLTYTSVGTITRSGLNPGADNSLRLFEAINSGSSTVGYLDHYNRSGSYEGFRVGGLYGGSISFEGGSFPEVLEIQADSYLLFDTEAETFFDVNGSNEANITFGNFTGGWHGGYIKHYKDPGANTDGTLSIETAANPNQVFLSGIGATSGNVGVGTQYSSSRLTVAGTLQIDYGGEACDADREGAIHYDSSSDEFYVCRTAGSWDSLPLPGGGLWTDNTTHISFESMHILKAGETMTSAGLDNGNTNAFIWIKDKGALRVGTGNSTTWDDEDIGQNSVAFGESTEASGENSVAFGVYAKSTGDSTFAFGNSTGTSAGGTRTVAWGSDVSVSGFDNYGYGRDLTMDSLSRRSVAYGLGAGAATHPEIGADGDESFTIFMGTQDGVVMNTQNQLSLFGGNMVIDPADPATQLVARTALDVGAATDAVILPAGLDADRPAGVAGMVRYNSTSDTFEGYVAGGTNNWVDLAASGGGSPASPDRGIQFNSGGAFTADSNFVYTSTGFVGLGTTVPQAELNIIDADADGVTEIFLGPTPTGGDAGRMQIYYDHNDKHGYIVNTYDDTTTQGHLRFVTGSWADWQPIVTMEAKNGAGVGIWDESPDARLEITHDDNFTDVPYLMISSTDAGDGDMLIFTSTGLLGLGNAAPSVTLDITGTDAIKVPAGTDAQRPGTPASGMIRYNSTSDTFEGYVAGGTNDWVNLSASASPGAPDRGIQFNSGGAFTADSNFVFTSTGRIGLGTDTPSARLEIYNGFSTNDALFINNQPLLSNDTDQSTGIEIINQATKSGDSTHTGDISGIDNTLYLNLTGLGSGVTVDNAYGIRTEIDGLGSSGLGPETINNAYNLYLTDSTPNILTINNAYGLYIETVDSGTASNHAIYSEGGDVYLGGNVGIGTASPAVSLDVAGLMRAIDDAAACTATERGAIRFNSAGAAVEFCDGSAWGAVGGSSAATPDRGIQFNSGGAFTADSNFVFTSVGDLIVGSYQTGDTGTGNEDYRMFFDVSKGAFRAGRVDGAEWDDSNVGVRSIATGWNTTASSGDSVAMGRETTASGLRSTAFGWNTVAGGDQSFAVGEYSAAYGDYSVAMGGYTTTATGSSYTTAMGINTTASGDYSTAIGNEVMAGDGTAGNGKGDYSVAFGLGDSAGGLSQLPQLTGQNAAGFFMGAQDDVVFASSNTFGVFGGSMVIDPADPATNLSADTAFEVEGTIKMAYGGEACDTAREGAIHYDSSSDEFNVCATSGSWETVSTGSGIWQTGTGDDIYYNSGTPQVGIGTTSPSEALDVAGTVRATKLNLTGETGNAPSVMGLDDLGDVDTSGYADGEVLMYSAGALGWVPGTASGGGTPAGADTQLQFNSGGSFGASNRLTWDGSQLFVNNGGGDGLYLGETGGTTSYVIAYSDDLLLSTQSGADNNIIFAVDDDGDGTSEEVARFTDDHRFGFADDTPDARFEISNDGSTSMPIFMLSSNDANDGDLFYVSSNGNIGIGNTSPDVELDVTGDIEYTGTITDVSDRRLKTDITPLDSGMAGKLAQLGTYSFRMKDDETGRKELGVIAQEVEEVFPELVKTAQDEMGTMSVNYVGFIAPLIEASKELKAENDTLKAELAEMKAQQSDIMKEVKGLKAHTGYGINKAQLGLWMLLAMLAASPVFFLIGAALGKRRRRTG